MGDLMGVRFAPICVPLRRRLQTLAVIHWLACLLFVGVATWLSCFAMLFTCMYPAVLLYFAWFVYDRRTPSRGGRRVPSVRAWRLWKHYARFFPVSLVTTAPLPTTRKNYILGVHPHGIMSHGAFANFATESTGCARLLPGLRVSLLTITFPLFCPFLREYLLSTGVCACSRESMIWLLTKEGPGNAVVLVVGGAMEALSAWPGSFQLYLSKRKGFIRVALQTGASLVPVFSFGENDLYEQKVSVEGSWLHWGQLKVKQYLGFSTPIFHGRGIFNYTFGFLPYRKPIIAVVGSPIDVEPVEDPTEEEVDNLHQRYINNLVKLFEQHKLNHGIDADQHLTIL